MYDAAGGYVTYTINGRGLSFNGGDSWTGTVGATNGDWNKNLQINASSSNSSYTSVELTITCHPYPGYKVKDGDDRKSIILSDGSRESIVITFERKFEHGEEPLNDPAYWEYYVSSIDFSKSGHSGSQSDPYLIGSAAELAKLAKDVRTAVNTYDNKYFKQIANIELGGHAWVPIGTSIIPFMGNYDGGNYKIEGLSINSAENYQGLFGYVYGPSYLSYEWSQIKNINLQGGTIEGGQHVGGVAGYAVGAVFSNCRSNISVTGSGYVGGILGNGSGAIANCVNLGTITSTGSFCGGICASYGGQIRYCSNFGDVSGTNYVGGVMGGCYGSLDYSTSNCNITGSGTGIGGLVGYLGTRTVRCCSARGYINYTGNASTVGGLVGAVTQDPWTIIIACSFVGTSNKALNLYGGTAKPNMTACYERCNSANQISSTVNDTWLQHWAVVANLNDGFPVQKALYWVADCVDTTVAQINAALPNAKIYS